MAASSSTPAADDNFICSICLEIYRKPFTITCGHTFCRECLKPCLQSPSPQCPVCRKVFDCKEKERSYDVESQMSSIKTTCKGCGAKIYISKMRSHNSTCVKLKEDVSDMRFNPVAKTSQRMPSDLPNRSTFECPFCGVANLDSLAMVNHCNAKHKNDDRHVVCPICSAMPWGDSNLRSSNFLSHLNMRHKFEYDTYVDYGADDEAMLQAALRASVRDSY